MGQARGSQVYASMLRFSKECVASDVRQILQHGTEGAMARLNLLILLVFASLLTPIPTTQAEVVLFDPGVGLTNYFGRMARPFTSPSDILVDPGSDFNHDMAPPIFDTDETQQPPVVEYHEAVRNFWTYLAIMSVTFVGGAYLLGRQVVTRGWEVGYTRKANALMLYFLPYIAMKGSSPYGATVTATLSLGVFLLLLMLMSAWFRHRIPALATAFASIDRPEDRPFTLTWLITSTFVAWVVILAWLWFAPQTIGYLFVALFISGVGDALAEPVGLYVGRHPYRTTALWTKRTYTRTLEGSATVFLSGFIAVLLVHRFEINPQSAAALLTFPIIGAIAEAKSPHTWDQPLIIASSALVAVVLSLVH